MTEAPIGRVVDPAGFFGLLRKIAGTRPDLVHTQAFRANLWARSASVLLRAPVVASVRATYSYLPRAYYPIERGLSKLTERVITPSVATSAHLVTSVGVSREKVVTIPNGVDTTVFDSSRGGGLFRKRWGLEKDFVIFAPGRLVPHKNHAGIMEAFRNIPATDHPAALVIAGAGPLDVDLRKQAATLKRKVILTGDLDRDSLADAMASADVVCLFSNREGMPNVVLEAMASGCPVVAARVDGVPELINNSVEGLLIPANDELQLTAAFVQLKNSLSLRSAMGIAGRRRVLERHSVDVNVTKHIEVFEAVIGSRINGWKE